MIYNYGSLNIDYVYQVTDFVRSGETISSHGLTIFPGGKGLNQSVALARAGAAVKHCGYVSADAGFLTDVLRQNGVYITLLHVVKQTNGHAIIQIDRTGQNCIMLFGGTNMLADASYAQQVAAQIQNQDILLLQNETSANDEMMRAAKQQGAFIVLNPSPINDILLALPLEWVDLFILNEEEGRVLTGQSEQDRIIDALRQRFPAAEVLLTLGKKGCVYAGRGERFALPIYEAGPVVDTTAAGDTFTGYFLAARTRGMTSS